VYVPSQARYPSPTVWVVEQVVLKSVDGGEHEKDWVRPAGPFHMAAIVPNPVASVAVMVTVITSPRDADVGFTVTEVITGPSVS